MKSVKPKKLAEISNEWDALSVTRQQIIEENNDISLVEVTAPCMVKEVSAINPNRTILDVGCGTGYLTSLLAKQAKICVGIDASKVSVSIAQKSYKHNNIRFIHSKISDFRCGFHFDICVANMVFSCDPEWLISIKSIYNLLSPDGSLLIMLPHPCFWHKYWNIDDEDWFSYEQDIFIEHDFPISKVSSLGLATYIHRPLHEYINGIIMSGYKLDCINELSGKDSNNNHKFLFIKCSKI